MKQTWLYKKLNYIQSDSLSSEHYNNSLVLVSIFNIIIFIFIGIIALLSPILWSVTFFLGIFKDLYDLYLYINREKIAKKEAIKKALELNNKIKKYIDNYQVLLDGTCIYMLEKITYEEKPKKESYDLEEFGKIYIQPPVRSFSYDRYIRNKHHNIEKEILSKEFINSLHSKFEDFIIEFFKTYNNKCYTVDIYRKPICDTNRRRSLHDIYLITKYYYPEVTFIDIIKTILSLLKIGIICGSYCSTVNKYVFYTPNVSNHNNFKRTLEFTDEITLNDLKKYIEDEQ